MHKRYVNHCAIELTIIPRGPILIKASDEGADPTKPNMEFVETIHAGGRSIYLPGSSLKGAIRAHAERIVRTVGSDTRPSDPSQLWASDPLKLDYAHLREGDKPKPGPEVYRLSSFTDQLFGNTEIASRLRIEDAYPNAEQPVQLEERNGVAIDRVFGSVAVGPFNFQVCTQGEFKTKIHLKNFTLAQLGLIGLVLRDLNEGWFGLGFGKSRGLGTVEVRLDKATVQYPGCVVDEGKIQALGRDQSWNHTALLGAGEFLEPAECSRYGFPKPDQQSTPVAASAMDLGFGAQLVWEGNGESGVPDLFGRAVKSWATVIPQGAAA
ncbi:MAG: CRISPR-associated protein [Synechococcales cyanobacterium RM1_1_8]|nr:CRISPR-associated protein [Synechococcales cyanobacterium RM1_1_8]